MVLYNISNLQILESYFIFSKNFYLENYKSWQPKILLKNALDA